MAKRYAVRVCTFGEIEVRSRTSYEDVKATALEAGRFSVFEATQNARAGRLFTRLCQDPGVVVERLGFPWARVAASGVPPMDGEANG